MSGTDTYLSLSNKIGGPCGEACQIGGNWSCVGNVSWPTTSSGARKVTVSFFNPLTDSSDSSTPSFPASVSVKLCAAVDPFCNTPLDVELTDSHGSVTFTYTQNTAVNGQNYGLDGYLDITMPGVDSIAPTLVFWGFPLSEANASITVPFPLLNDQELSDYLSAAGVVLNPGLGQLGVVALDCLGIQAPRVSFAASAGGQTASHIFYVDGPVPNPKGPTMMTGTALLPNLPVGSVTVSFTPIALGRPASSVQAFLRPGVLTEVGMSPTPAAMTAMH